MFANSLLATVLCVMPMQNDLPTVEVTTDDALIDKSCRIVIPPQTVIEDVNGDGVIQIAASDIEIEFADGSVLRGAAPGTRPDEYRGYGIRLNGHEHVSICHARISGYWCAIWATKADGLTVEGVDASDNRRAYLKSTPVAEDGGDWLFPHRNDNNEWLTQYAAAFYIEDSGKVTVRGCKVWHGQNGLCLDRVNDSKIYDNDLSFNSGWGIALWRSSHNIISRNACDFCVRGYSHGVYNRGQDSAGILMFEQNNENVIAENSATHGGDCFFGFAGREALGEDWANGERDRLRKELGPGGIEDSRKRLAEKLGPVWLDPQKVPDDRVIDELIVVPPELAQEHKARGNTDNLLINNDFSYAPAHGIEMTFSFGNRFIGNRMVENAICGVWGGYSQKTLIAGNEFVGNGEMAYGLERGGVNIEHGRKNRIVDNKFRYNKCGVHLWWDPEGGFAKTPWAAANLTDSDENVIASNEFIGDELVLHLRLVRDELYPTRGKNEVTLGYNDILRAGKLIEADAESKLTRRSSYKVEPRPPKYEALGETRPVGARKHLQGRRNIIMTEWGPWDHESPLVRLVSSSGRSVMYDLHKLPGEPQVVVEGERVQGLLAVSETQDVAPRYTIESIAPGVHPYVMRVSAGDFKTQLAGTLIDAKWDATFFKWMAEADPREQLDDWRALARGESAISAEVRQLTFKYAFGGPSEQDVSDAVRAAKLGGDHFGMIARTKLPLPGGRWQFATMSDDGVRVTVDGEPVIDNWTWHPPRRDVGTFELPADKTVEIVVEHFEIDGYAVLELEISRAE